MKTTIVNTTKESIVRRTITLEGIASEIQMTRNELEKHTTCYYNRANADGTTTNIALRYELEQAVFSSDSLSKSQGVEDYELYEELKAQLLTFNAEYDDTTENTED